MNNTELIAQARANIGTSLATSYLLRLADALEAAQPAPQVPMTEPVKQAPPKGWMPDALRRAGFSEDEIKGVKP